MKNLPKNASQFSDLYSLSFNERVGYSIWHSTTQEGFYHCDSWLIKTKAWFLQIQKRMSDSPAIFQQFPCDSKSFPSWWMNFWDERFFFKTIFSLSQLFVLTHKNSPMILDALDRGVARTIGRRLHGNSDHSDQDGGNFQAYRGSRIETNPTIFPFTIPAIVQKG